MARETAREMPLRRNRVRAFLNSEAGAPYPRCSKCFFAFIMLLIVLSTVLSVVETEPDLKRLQLPFFFAFEACTVGVFTLEYLLRLWSCEDQKYLAFAFAGFNLIDLAAFLPFYLEVAVVGAVPEPADGWHDHWLGQVVAILRLPRVLRLFKVARHSPVFNIFIRAVVDSRDAVVILVSLLSFCLIFVGTLVHLCEKGQWREKLALYLRYDGGGGGGGQLALSGATGAVTEAEFNSVLRSMWWCLATLTTVGYGDEGPSTAAGKAVGSVTMILGILIIALPVSVLGANFQEEYERYDKQKQAAALERERRRQAAKRRWRDVRDVAVGRAAELGAAARSKAAWNKPSSDGSGLAYQVPIAAGKDQQRAARPAPLGLAPRQDMAQVVWQLLLLEKSSSMSEPGKASSAAAAAAAAAVGPPGSPGPPGARRESGAAERDGRSSQNESGMKEKADSAELLVNQLCKDLLRAGDAVDLMRNGRTSSSSSSSSSSACSTVEGRGIIEWCRLVGLDDAVCEDHPPVAGLVAELPARASHMRECVQRCTESLERLSALNLAMISLMARLS